MHKLLKKIVSQTDKGIDDSQISNDCKLAMTTVCILTQSPRICRLRSRTGVLGGKAGRFSALADNIHWASSVRK